jgi:hypothetical protein
MMDGRKMKIRILTLAAIFSAMSLAALAQQAPAPELGAAVDNSESTHSAPFRVIDPKQLVPISENSVRDNLAVQTTFGNEEASVKPFAGAGLPIFIYTSGANTGSIVGTAPGNAITTTVPTVVVPVVLNITQGGTLFSFNPTATDPGCLGGANTAISLFGGSPFFQSVPITMNGVNEGVTQYIDAFQRAEFATTVNANNHTLLSGVVGPTLTISVTAPAGGSATAAVFGLNGTQCGTNPGPVNKRAVLAVININTINAILQNYIAANGIQPSQLPFFVLYNSVISNGAANNLANCCILGFHTSIGGTVANPGQTYGISTFEGRNQTVFAGVADVSVIAHELGEWADDPSGVNPTPAWGGIGQVAGCQGNLEVGDPMSGILVPSIALGGFTYHFQELAFFSWFYRDAPSQGAGGKYSSNGTFAGFSKNCPPGGTF